MIHEQVNIEWLLPYKGNTLVPTYEVTPEDAYEKDDSGNRFGSADEYHEDIEVPKYLHSFKVNDKVNYRWKDGTEAVGHVEKV